MSLPRVEVLKKESEQILTVVLAYLDANDGLRHFRIPFDKVDIHPDRFFPASRRADWEEFCIDKEINIRVSRTKGYLRVKRLTPTELKASKRIVTPVSELSNETATATTTTKLQIDPDYYYMPPKHKIIEKGMAAKMNILMYGPAGTGKSSLLRKMCENLYHDWDFMNLSGETSVDDFVGTYELIKGETIFNRGVLPNAMENGTPLIIDELDAASPEILFVLQGVLEGAPLRLKTNEKIHSQPGFGIFATANTIGKGDDTTLYQGTNVLNEAFLDRFGMVVHLWYMKSKHEIEVLRRRTGMHKSIAEKIVAVANLAREAMKSGKLFSTFSTRKCLAWSNLMMQNVSFDDAYRLTCINKVQDSDKIVLAELYQRVMGKTIKVDDD